MPTLTVSPWVSFKVHCIKPSGRMVWREFADRDVSARFFDGAVASGNYVNVCLTGYTADGDWVEFHTWFN